MGSVLIADGDSASRDLLGQALGASGWRIETATSGGEILQRMVKSKVGTLIVEVHLSDMPVWELIPRVRRLDPEMPIIAITADDSWETSRRVRVEGGPVFFYGLKPLDLKEMCRVVDSALGWREKHCRARHATWQNGGNHANVKR